MTTNELTRRVAEVASSAALIEDTARVLSQAAGDTTDGATATEQTAGRVASSAHDLRELLDRFRY